jgi:magnesium chelatase subunit I
MEKHPTTLADLKASGYRPRSVKHELRDNLIARIRQGLPLFDDVHGYEDTVLPALERAILAGHHINLLGLRGQAKTRMARSLVKLLDEHIPVVAGSELNDDPLAPVSRFAKDLIAEMGDRTPVAWLHRDQRYTEKLATPDVTVADLIGDSDPIKAANLKLPYGDERVVHFGLVPRSHRGIFVINELPDLQPRIQVALFNILQEGDVQIRGFKLRLPLDIQFVFTANPEDYTNRGAIITPLKDRIQSQILTHYPRNIGQAMRITAQEARLTAEQQERVRIPDLLRVLVERIAMEARESEFVDRRSGVSARATISALETLAATAERRLLKTGGVRTVARVADLFAVVPAITGKVELAYEGEQEGAEHVAQHLIGLAVRNVFAELFPAISKSRKRSAAPDPFAPVVAHFEERAMDLPAEASDTAHARALRSIDGLLDLVRTSHDYLDEEEQVLWAEFVLHGLAEHSRIGRVLVNGSPRFEDLMSRIVGGSDGEAGE